MESFKQFKSEYDEWRKEMNESMKSLHKHLKRRIPTDVIGRVYISDGLWLNADGSIDDEKDG